MQKDYSHRLGKKTVRFLREDGSAAAGKTVKVEMQNHEFLWGTGLFDSIPYACGDMQGERKEAFERKFEKWIALFNNTTLPFYWGGFERERGKPKTAETLTGAKWLTAQGIKVKGHPLCWHTGTAPWLMDMTNADIIKTQLERIYRDVSYFEGVIDMWDVINEVVIMPIFDKYDNGITRICKEMGRVKTVKTMFDAARATNPDATLLINDFNLSTNYEILIDGCLNAGVSIDAIGLQTHQHQGYMGAERLQEVLRRYEFFNLPLHFTENTLTSGHIMPPEIDDLNDYKVTEWPTTPEFEDRQAREFIEMYEILYSHPLVEAAVSWEFTDGGWLGAPSGLLRKDGSAKPAYYALLELIKGKWWTNTELVTDANGEIEVEGYRGDYTLTMENKKIPLALRKGQTDGVQIVSI